MRRHYQVGESSRTRFQNGVKCNKTLDPAPRVAASFTETGCGAASVFDFLVSPLCASTGVKILSPAAVELAER